MARHDRAATRPVYGRRAPLPAAALLYTFHLRRTARMSRSLWLTIEGARQNNLKNVTVAIPHDRLTVITGVSGSGKSSLAFDTLFAEGQWRYIESLSTYARMF